MTFSGFEKTDLINFPGYVASTVFTCGCNFRCPYCHNPEFVVNGSDETYFGETYTETDVLSYLTKRRSMIDALVISGGEPTLHPDLAQFITEVRKLGLKIKLDTNGSRPHVLRDLLNGNLLDYVAMDIKAPFQKYALLGFEDTQAIAESIIILRNSRTEHEFRTTCPKNLITETDFRTIASHIGDDQIWYLQPFNPRKTLDPSYRNAEPYTKEDLEEVIRTLGRPNTYVR